MQKLKSKIFSPDSVNSGRQIELDLAKFILIFCLALIHCIIECTPEPELAYGIPYLFDTVIGGPLSAPMFLFAMGIGIAYKNSSFQGILKRSMSLGLIGFALNIARFLIPFMVGFLLTGDHEHYMEPLLFRVLCNDVLQFASLAFLLMAFLIKWRLSEIGLLVIGLIFSMIGTLLNGFHVSSDVGNILLGYFIGTETPGGDPWIFSDFPLLNWFIVPVSGYLFGKRLMHVRNKNLFYAISSSLCGAAAILYFTFGIIFETGMFGEGQNCYYHITTPDVIASLLAAIAALGFYHVVSRYIPGKLKAKISSVSKNINSVYCIHWIFVSWIVMVLLYYLRGTSYLPVGYTLLVGACISIVSILTAGLWSNRIKPAFQRAGKENVHEKTKT